MDFYVTIGDIKDTIHTYWNDHHTSSKFPEILHILYEIKNILTMNLFCRTLARLHDLMMILSYQKFGNFTSVSRIRFFPISIHLTLFRLLHT